MNRRIVRFGDALLGASSIVGQGAAGLILMHSRTRAGRGFMLDTTLTIGYDTPWHQVGAMLTEAARRRAAHPPARQHPGRLQRIRRADPVTPLPRRSGNRKSRAAR
ncbi:hypothetical protein [Zoogloea sp.]|uniref:hypothetical protein n=1 Tax=Zoogloea sp. TaxID=49181 RepID=UPI0035B27022